MPRFHIETFDGEVVLDPEGQVLVDSAAARFAGLDALPDMARDQIPDGDRRDFVVDVRDDEGRLIYTATLSLVGRWVDRRERDPETAGAGIRTLASRFP